MSISTFKKIRVVLWIILAANVVVAALKVAIGMLIKSTSMTADGFHSFTDGSSNIIGLIAVWFASKPVDEDHPYGHRKFETLAGLGIAAMLVFIGGKIIMDAVTRLFTPVAPDITLESLFVLLATLGINIFVSTYEYRQGKKLGSQILISDSMHTRSDIYVSLGVLVTLVGIKLGLPAWIDSLASLVVSAFILHAAWEIFSSTSGVLVDKAVVDIERVRKIAMEFEQVKNAYKIRSRGCEPDLYIDLHIMTDPDMSVEDSHTLIHNMELKMKEELNTNVELIVHIEPYKENVIA